MLVREGHKWLVSVSVIRIGEDDVINSIFEIHESYMHISLPIVLYTVCIITP